MLIGFPTLYQSFTSFLIGLSRSTSEYINQLGFCFVLFLTYYSVECQTNSLSNLCFRFAMLPIFLAILKLILYSLCYALSFTLLHTLNPSSNMLYLLRFMLHALSYRLFCFMLFTRFIVHPLSCTLILQALSYTFYILQALSCTLYLYI